MKHQAEKNKQAFEFIQYIPDLIGLFIFSRVNTEKITQRW